MKLKTLIIMGLLSTLSLNGCAQRPGPLGEKTIKLDNFDFSTPITDIFPEHFVDTTIGADWYKIPSYMESSLYHKEACKDYEDNPLWVTYKNLSSCNADKYLSMAEYTFCTADIVTTLDGRIFAIGGYEGDITQEDCDNFIAFLSKRYGDPERATGNFSSNLYKWKLKDRTLTFAVKSTDEHNVLKIEKVYNEDGSLADIREGKRRNKLDGYFFVFDGEWYDRFVNTKCSKSGNITYSY